MSRSTRRAELRRYAEFRVKSSRNSGGTRLTATAAERYGTEVAGAKGSPLYTTRASAVMTGVRLRVGIPIQRDQRPTNLSVVGNIAADSSKNAAGRQGGIYKPSRSAPRQRNGSPDTTELTPNQDLCRSQVQQNIEWPQRLVQFRPRPTSLPNCKGE